MLSAGSSVRLRPALPSQSRAFFRRHLLATHLLTSGILVTSPWLPDVYSFALKASDLKVWGAVVELFDDNVILRKRDRQSDFITRFSYGIGLSHETRLGSFEFSTGMEHNLFARDSNLSNTSANLTLDWNAELSKHDRLSLHDVFSRSFEPQNFDEAFSRTGGRYGAYRNRLQTHYARDLTKELTLNGRYGHELDDPTRDELPQAQLHTAGLQADYAFSSALILKSSYTFTHRALDPGGSASIHTIAGGLRKYLTKQLYLDGTAGMDLIDDYQDRFSTKPQFSASLIDETDAQSTAGLSVSRSYLTSPFSQDLAGTWRVTASFARQLLKRVKAQVAAFFGRADYVRSGVRDTLWGLQLRALYDFSEATKGVAGYTLTDAISDDPARAYVRNLVFVGLRIEF